MVEKIGTIKNPLTIIAIFAAIAEISGTAVLPFVSEGNQETYIWFLMIFPLLLVLLFFLTLNFNHKVLYAPSDFKDEENFFKSVQPASPTERVEKLKEQVREIESEIKSKQKPIAVPSTEGVVLSAVSQRDIRARYSLAEELVLSKIAKELGQPVHRYMRFTTQGGRFVFDGMVITEERVTAIEIKYFRDSKSISSRFKDVFHKILTAAERLPDSMRNRLSLVLAVVTEADAEDHDHFSERLYPLIGVTPFPVEIRVFSLEELEKEFNLAA